MAAYEEGDVSNGGTITGTVKFVGDVPEVKMLNMDKDQETCGHDPSPSEALLISPDKTIKNAIVSIQNISKGKKFERPAENPSIDQKGCIFIPHVKMVPQGSTINLLNSDDVMHNLHSWSMKNTAFNEGVAGGGKLPKTFEYPETIKMTCDVHKWMTSWLIVQDNPYYALTGENGKFKIKDVPPGTYTLRAWQESLGKRYEIQLEPVYANPREGRVLFGKGDRTISPSFVSATSEEKSPLIGSYHRTL